MTAAPTSMDLTHALVAWLRDLDDYHTRFPPGAETAEHDALMARKQELLDQIERLDGEVSG